MPTATAARKPATKRASATKAKPRPATRSQRNAHALQRARTVAPAAPRRKSGPVRRPMPQRTVAAPPRTAPALARRVARGGTTILLDNILRGRAWVALIGVLLAGIVYLNVDVLELNRGIAATSAKTDKLERMNSKLRGRVARLDSAERIQQLAEARGFVLPQPGDVTYLKPRPAHDAKLASERIAPPSDETTTAEPTDTTTPAPTEVAPSTTDTTTAPPITPEPMPVASTTVAPTTP
jgi:cell division protein FtsB